MKCYKLLCLALALMLVFSMTACGDTGAGDGTTKSENVSSTQSTGSVEENDLSLGRFENGVYTNDYIGVSCTLDSKWTYYSADQLQELPDSVTDQLSGSALGDAMANYSQIFDMMAENTEDLTVINVVYTKLSAAEKAQYQAMNEEETIDSILSQKELLIEAYAQAGISVNQLTKVLVSFMGEPHYALHMDASVSGIPYYTLQFSYSQLGDFSVSLTLGSYQEDRTTGMMLLFAPAE